MTISQQKNSSAAKWRKRLCLHTDLLEENASPSCPMIWKGGKKKLFELFDISDLNKLQLHHGAQKPQKASNNCCHNNLFFSSTPLKKKKSVHVSKINHRLSLQGSNAEARPHPTLLAEGEPVHRRHQSVVRAELMDRRADRTWCTRLAVWIHDGQVYRSGEQHGLAGRANGAETWRWLRSSSKPDKRLLCFFQGGGGGSCSSSK